MITSIFVNFLGAMAFLFFFWRRLREDYPTNQIFSTAFFMLSGVLGGWLISREFFPAWFFWAQALGASLGFLVGTFHFKFRLHESLEAAAVSFLPWLAFYFLKDASLSASIVSLGGFLFCLFLLALFYVLDVHYKRFTWYRSGRVGFAGLTVAGLFFLTRAAVAAFYPYVLTFAGRAEAIPSGVVAFIFFLLIYNLSKSEV